MPFTNTQMIEVSEVCLLWMEDNQISVKEIYPRLPYIITELQNGWCWKRSLWIIYFTTPVQNKVS